MTTSLQKGGPTLPGEWKQEREALVGACRRIADRGLVVGTAGNVSVRSGDFVAVTPTGARLENLTAAEVSIVDMAGELVDGDLAPTSELGLHLGIYAATGAGAVAHAHAMASTAVASARSELPCVHYSALGLGGSVRVAPYATYGSPELAANVLAALEGRSAALMQNHGSVVYGGSLAEAVERLELLEWLAELYSRCLAIGTPRILGEAELLDVVRTATESGYGTVRKATPADQAVTG
ncbi:class II aldolase/adducin family protein [Amycolatopsis halotolerans]|uniref:Class II aldolase/adducin family protein n=1 Tax=Amycolatopsis halotolerans TaxID=330083 RepID=A0ABV7QBJ0_9PSEU